MQDQLQRKTNYLIFVFLKVPVPQGREIGPAQKQHIKANPQTVRQIQTTPLQMPMVSDRCGFVTIICTTLRLQLTPWAPIPIELAKISCAHGIVWSHSDKTSIA